MYFFFLCSANQAEIPMMGVRVMVFDATFNNISVISLRSDLLVEETRVPGENHLPAASHKFSGDR